MWTPANRHLAFVLAIILGSFLLLDAAYISAISTLFGTMIERIQGSPMSVNLWGAAVCYLTITFGLYYFIIREKRSPFDAGLLGLVIYAVYETTSLATLKKWDKNIVLIDSAWGFVLFYLTTMVVYYFDK